MKQKIFGILEDDCRLVGNFSRIVQVCFSLSILSCAFRSHSLMAFSMAKSVKCSSPSMDWTDSTRYKDNANRMRFVK